MIVVPMSTAAVEHPIAETEGKALRAAIGIGDRSRAARWAVRRCAEEGQRVACGGRGQADGLPMRDHVVRGAV